MSRLLLFMLSTVCLASCDAVGSGRSDDAAVPGRVTVQDGIRLLDVAAPSPGRDRGLKPDGTWAGDLPLVAISDAKLLGDGMAVLVDERGAEAWLVPLAPGTATRFSARGGGPGESQLPLAGVPTQDGILLWDAGRQTFSLFQESGQLRLAVSQPEDGDTDRFNRRLANARRQSNHQLRVRAAGDAVWFLLEDDEFEIAGPPGSSTGTIEVPRRGYLTRLASDFRSADTVLTFQATTRYLEPGSPSSGAGVFEWERLWTVGDSLIAIGRSDSAVVTILRTDRKPVAVVRWPAVHRPITRDDKRGHARAIVRERGWAFPAEARDETMLMEAADRMQTVEFAPELTGIELLGRCLWLSPFDVRDNSDGVSRTWWYYDLETGAGRSVTFDSEAVRPMHFTARFVLARRVEEDERHSIRRYSLPERVRSDCGLR